MKKLSYLSAALLAALPTVALADAIGGAVQKQETNWAAIGMFVTQAYIVDRNRRALHISFTVAK